MKISVAAAIYNGERFFKTLASSVKAQTKIADQVVLCDDCSSDDTGFVAENFIEENGLNNWTLYKNSENLGFRANFKQALSLCNGDIIFLCDQDDIWDKRKIEKITEFFASHKDALAVASSFRLIDSNDEEISDNKKGSNHGLINRKIKIGESVSIPLNTVLHSNISPGCTLAVRRTLAQEFCKKTVSKLAHDWELCLVAAARNGLYFVNEELVYYRLHENNTLGFAESKQTREEIALEKYEAVSELCKFEDLEGLKVFLSLRLTALKNKKTLNLIKLWFNKHYKFFSLRERLGDILYTIK